MSYEFNRLALRAVVLAMLLPTTVLAWPPGGVAVAPVPERGQEEPHLLLGRDGLVLAFWSDGRWLEQQRDLYGQLLTRHGSVATGWPDTGLMIARAERDQRAASGLAHPDGSFIVGMHDTRNLVFGGSGSDQYISRVLPDGRIDPVWPRHGFRVTDREVSEASNHMAWAAPDTLVALSGFPVDSLGGYAVRLLLQSVALTPEGPRALWGSSGTLISGGTGGTTFDPLIPDGAGGVFIVHDEVESGIWMPGGPNVTDIYVTRVGRDGLLAPGWEGGAKPIAVAIGYQEFASVVPDGAGGLFVAWADGRDGAGADIRLMRLTPTGVPYPGWPGDGLVVSNIRRSQSLTSLAPDGDGGVYVAWDAQTIGVTRVRGDGTFAPGWSVDGLEISTIFAWASDSRMVPDGFGGVYVLFQDVSRADLYLQHVLPWGMVDPGWPTSGELVSLGGEGDIVSDGAGGCYVAFLKLVSPPEFWTWVHVARYDMDGPVPVKLAEATIEAEPGRVHLEWRGAEVTTAELMVQRRTEAVETWTSLGAPTARGREVVEYDDTTVEPGRRYAYRLIRGAEPMSAEQWVSVPEAAVFALAGARPNPARSHELGVAFTLAGTGRAALEVLDLAGRREHVRALTGLGPGSHALSLAEARLAPGIHWVQLTEGVKRAQTRIVVVR